MKIIIQDIPQGLIEPETIKRLNENGIVACYRGNKIDIEIENKKLAERILKEECNFLF